MFALMLAASSVGADPQFAVENKCPPLFEVVNRVADLEKRVGKLEAKSGDGPRVVAGLLPRRVTKAELVGDAVLRLTWVANVGAVQMTSLFDVAGLVVTFDGAAGKVTDAPAWVTAHPGCRYTSALDGSQIDFTSGTASKEEADPDLRACKCGPNGCGCLSAGATPRSYFVCPTAMVPPGKCEVCEAKKGSCPRDGAAKQCPECCPPTAGKRDDPYGFTDYAKFRTAIASGRHGELYVGIPGASVGTYTPHCRVPSGFGGLDDGKYDCFFQDGDARLTPVAPRATAAQPLPAGAGCAGGSCAAPAAAQPAFGVFGGCSGGSCGSPATLGSPVYGGGCSGGSCSGAPRGIFRR